MEEPARETLDKLLLRAGWVVCDPDKTNIHACLGVAIREFPLKSGHGFADYLLYVNGKAAGVVEAKKEGVTLSGVETQFDKYTAGLPDGFPRWSNPLPFAYRSTGLETRLTNGLDPPQLRSRPVFAFHKPETLAGWLDEARAFEAAPPIEPGSPHQSSQGRFWYCSRWSARKSLCVSSVGNARGRDSVESPRFLMDTS
jgi:type I restriction enzyme R subunit